MVISICFIKRLIFDFNRWYLPFIYISTTTALKAFIKHVIAFTQVVLCGEKHFFENVEFYLQK